MKYFLVGSLIGLLACGGCCVGTVVFLINGFVSDAEQIGQLADQMVDWEFNDELSGEFGLNYFLLSVVGLADPDKGMVILMQSRLITDDQSASEVRKSIRRQMEFGSNDDREQTDVIEGGERTIEIRGQQVPLMFNKTRGRESGKIFWEIAGVIPGKPWPVVLFMELRDDAYSDDVIEQRLRSIR